MKTLEQVIADCKEEISDCQIDLDGILELLEEHPERKEAFAHEIGNYKKRMDYNRQLAEWLRELQERRKAPEIIFLQKTVQIGELRIVQWYKNQSIGLIPMGIAILRKGEPTNDEMGS